MSVAKPPAQENTPPSLAQSSERRSMAKIVLGSAVGRLIADTTERIWDALVH